MAVRTGAHRLRRPLSKLSPFSIERYRMYILDQSHEDRELTPHLLLLGSLCCMSTSNKQNPTVKSFSGADTGGGKHIISVSEKQRGNPLLKHIRNVQWEFNKEIVPDYVMGSTCAIFLSIKYHALHSKHAELRIRELGKNFRLRILLVLVDVDDDISVKPLHELNKLCFTSDVTLLLCWSNEECARYLEILKLYENKSAASIQEKVVVFWE